MFNRSAVVGLFNSTFFKNCFLFKESILLKSLNVGIQTDSSLANNETRNKPTTHLINKNKKNDLKKFEFDKREKEWSVNKKFQKNKNFNYLSPSGNGRNGKRQFMAKPNRNDENKFIFKGKSNQLMNGLYDKEFDPEENAESEENLELYSTNQNLYHEKVIDEDMRDRRRKKIAIIRKKMDKLEGKKRETFNLLTWDAKEQIKYLNNEDPEYWTAEKISESYPISIGDCKKLLKSVWSPKTLDDLARHDQKVIDNWKLLAKSLKQEPGGPPINIYEEYKKQNKLALLKHACGMPGIEFKRSSKIFNDSYSIHETLICKPGSFSNIVKRDDYVKKLFTKEADKRLESELKKLIEMKKSYSIEEHSLLTKEELTKSLSNIISN